MELFKGLCIGHTHTHTQKPIDKHEGEKERERAKVKKRISYHTSCMHKERKDSEFANLLKSITSHPTDKEVRRMQAKERIAGWSKFAIKIDGGK